MSNSKIPSIFDHRVLDSSTIESNYHQCLKCRHTFRVYPQGVSGAQTSQRVKGLAVMLSLLGLSYGAVSLALEALGDSLCKSRVYDAVQDAAKQVPGLKREQVFTGVRTPALGGDLTSVKCKGQWLPLGITGDPITGLALTIDALSAEDTKTLQEWIESIAQSVGATILVTDDADGFKTIADEIGVHHQVCKSHVVRNTESLIERFQGMIKQGNDASLQAIGVSSEQVQADLRRLGELIKSRKREEAAEVEQMHRRYLQVAPPGPGKHMSLAYRLRLLFLDRWNLWHRLTRYRKWEGPKGKRSMAPTMPVSVPSAGGSKNAIARCVATRCRRMQCASVAYLPDVATSSRWGTEPTCQCSCSKEEAHRSLTTCSFPTSQHQVSDDHQFTLCLKARGPLAALLVEVGNLTEGWTDFGLKCPRDTQRDMSN